MRFLIILILSLIALSSNAQIIKSNAIMELNNMDFSTPCTSCSEWRYSRNTNFLYRWNGTSWIIYNPGSTLNLGLSMPGIFNVSPSTLTGSGTFNVTLNSQAQNTFLAAPSNASGVPTFRTLTPSDLSVAGGLSGTSSAGRVAFYSGTSTLTGDANLTWDNSDKSLSLGGSGVSSSLLTLNSTTRGILIPRMTTTQKNAIVAPATGLLVYDLTLGAFNVYNGSAWVSVGGGLPAGSNGQIQFNNNNVFGASSNLFWDNTNNRLGINASSIANLNVRGSSGSTQVFSVEGSDGSNRFYVPNSQSNTGLIFNSGWGGIDFAGVSSAQHIRVTSGTSPMSFRGRGTTTASSYSFQFFTAESNTLAASAGSETGLFSIQDLQFSPSAQSANYSLLRLTSTINQTGSSNGITRSLYIDPTLTSASNYRVIEVKIPVSRTTRMLHLEGTGGTTQLNDFGSSAGSEIRYVNNSNQFSSLYLYPQADIGAGFIFSNAGAGLFVGNNTVLTGIGAKLHVRGSGSDNNASSLLIQNSLARTLFSVRNDGLAQLGRNTAVTTQEVAQIEVVSDDTNTGLVLTPKGNGAIIAGPAPDGTAVGGNARGGNAVDFQRFRDANTKVASGMNSVIINGYNNTASATYAAVISGNANIASAEAALASGQSTASGAYSTALGVATASGSRSAALGGGRASGQFSFSAGEFGTGVASGDYSVALGYRNTASGIASFAVNGGMAGIGGGNIASANFSSSFGRGSRSYLMGQIALASYDNHAQTSFVNVRSIVTGSLVTELFIDGTAERLVPALPTGQTSGRIWNARIQCVATVVTQGAGTAPAGSSFIQTYDVGIKRIGNTTTLIGGAPIATSATGDNAMSGANFIITADDTNEALKVEFQPPGTVGSDTVIRAIATIYLTELGY